jgi:hypothetical protein
VFCVGALQVPFIEKIEGTLAHGKSGWGGFERLRMEWLRGNPKMPLADFHRARAEDTINLATVEYGELRLFTKSQPPALDSSEPGLLRFAVRWHMSGLEARFAPDVGSRLARTAHIARQVMRQLDTVAHSAEMEKLYATAIKYGNAGDVALVRMAHMHEASILRQQHLLVDSSIVNLTKRNLRECHAMLRVRLRVHQAPEVPAFKARPRGSSAGAHAAPAPPGRRKEVPTSIALSGTTVAAFFFLLLFLFWLEVQELMTLCGLPLDLANRS